MFSGQVNWTEQSDAAGGLVARDSVVDGDGSLTAFELVYAALLSLSDEPCSAIRMSDDWLDTGVEGDLTAGDSEVLGAVSNIDSGTRGYPLTSRPHDNELTLDYFEAQYSVSSMDRLTAHGRVAQLEAVPSLDADRQFGVPDSRARQTETTVLTTESVGAAALPSSSAGVFDKTQLSTWMDAHALLRSSHHCAMYCRLGMEAAGLNTRDRPQSGDAGDYGPFLLRHGAKKVPQNFYNPQVGDVVVFDKTESHPHGHIEMYDGQHWVSDFMQHSFSPYHDASSCPPFTIYRIA